jgi:hypothetical protein
MKTALLLTGNPRFSKDFKSQIYNLQNSQVDWYITFWNRPFGFDPKVSENWCNLTTAGNIRDRLKPHLPSNHKIKFVEILEPGIFDSPPKEYEIFNSNPKNVWDQYKILQYCDHWRRELGDYELVVRSRTDLGLSERIDLKLAFQSLLKNPNCIYTPSNQRNGYEPYFNDQFAIGLASIMEFYCDAIDDFDFLYETGVKYNPEYLLQSSLSNKGIIWPPTTFEIVRDIGHWVPIEHGEWEEI